MPITENLSTEESKLMSDMQAQEPAERELIREEKTGVIPNSEPEIELSPEAQKFLDPKVEEPKVEEVKVEEPKEKRLVPLSELQEERKSRKDAQEAARIAQERMDMLLARLTPPEPVKQPVDVDTDPIGAVKEIKGELEQLRQYRAEQELQAQQHQYTRTVMDTAIQQENEFVKQTPDYNEAGNFLRTQRTNQLLALGYTAQEAKQAVINESIDLADRILKKGGNVPEALYKLARSSGYAQKVAAATISSDQERLENVAKGQRANVSLSNANGVQAKTGLLNGAAIAKMSESEFAAFYEKLNSNDRRAVLGQ